MSATASLSETDQLKVEKAQLQLELLESRRISTATELTSILEGYCKSVGGKTLADCNVTLPQAQGSRITVSIKPPSESKK